MIDRERRKRVMQRSMRLGHCICNPRQPCPCPTFKQQDICTCAGERPQVDGRPVRLTKLVERPGCASKIDQDLLKEVLADLPEIKDPNVIVGVAAGDDAGIYQIPAGPALVQTVDVFTPCVDDPYTFGQIAAANSVSDVYAMGGRPLTALSIVGIPVGQVPDEVLSQILSGGIERMNQAGCSVIGGHSINDQQIKAGFAVTGLIDRDCIITNAGARPGDALILTKPIGTGIIAFAGQIDRARPQDLSAAIESMTTLNKVASELMVQFKAHACTDVTGFGLMGHLAEMARSSGVDVEVVWDWIPLLPGVIDYATAGILPGGIERNRHACGHNVQPDPRIQQEMVDVCYDPQTSGGLLIAIEIARADAMLKALRQAGARAAAIIGRVLAKGNGTIHLTTDCSRKVPEGVSPIPTPEKDLQPAPCCAEANGPAATSKIGQIRGKFLEFLGAAASPHGLDAYTKQAIAIALSVAMRCEPCLRMHIKKAREKGFTDAEIEEAAWMGISFAGSPSMAFYDTMVKGLDRR